jgi:acyl-CoA synthetase (AMP-forming)/AMP-acid ligase II
MAPPKTWVTLVDLLRHQAEKRGDRVAYTYLTDGEVESEWLSYAELDLRARAIAAHLQEQGVEGERALLLYPSGLDFIAAFLGALGELWLAGAEIDW